MKHLLVSLTAEYCTLVWCHSIHTPLIDSVFIDALLIVTGCLHPTPTNHLSILPGIQPTKLCQLEATLFSAYCGSSDACHERLRSRHPFASCMESINNLARLGICTLSGQIIDGMWSIARIHPGFMFSYLGPV